MQLIYGLSCDMHTQVSLCKIANLLPVFHHEASLTVIMLLVLSHAV